MAAPFVQTANSGTPSGTATSKTTTFSLAQTAGNLNIVVVSFGLPSASFTVPTITVTDTKGNPYTAVGPMVQHGGSGNSCGTIVYYAPNIAAATAGTNVVTVGLSSAFNFFIIGIYEFSGVATATPLEAYANNLANLPASTSVSSGNANTVTANDLLFGVSECFDGAGTIGSGWTQETSQYTLCAGYQVASSAGSYAFTGTAPGTSGWTAWVVAFHPPLVQPPAPSNIATEVLLSQQMTVSEGIPVSLQDANSWSFWNTAHSGASAKIDAGAAMTLTRIRLSPQPGGEDLAIGGVIQGSNDSTFSTGVATIYTIATRPITGNLLNEYLVSPGAAYRYYRYLTSSATNSGISDLDFIGIFATGLWAIPCAPVLSPTCAQYDVPTRFRLSCITADSTIYYTLDGSAPSASSIQYTGPIPISSSCTLRAVAISPAGGTSRTISYPIHILNTEVSTDNIYDNRGARLWALNGNLFRDPVSGYWYRYGVNFDTPSVYTYGNIGNNIYRSPDLRNWEYRGVAMAPTAGNAIGPTNNDYEIAMHVVYNAANHNYVAWTDSFTATNITTFVWNGKKVWTSASPEGPFSLVQTYNGNIGGQSPLGDFCIFIDTDGVTAYLVTTTSGNLNLIVNKLDSTYTLLTGTLNVYAYTSIYGSGQYEAPFLFWNGSTYILLNSPGEGFSGGLGPTHYATASSPLGPFTVVAGNPFQPVSGGNPDYTTSYDSQIWQILYVPGRNAYIYHGDRYDVDGNNSFNNSRRIRLPVTFPTSSTLSISWNAAWAFDAQFPTISGSPLAATALAGSFSGGAISLSWRNNEPKAAAIYVDRANDAGFTTGVASEVVAAGATSFSDSLVTPGANYYYRVRSVNANGSANSAILSISAISQPPTSSMGNPPFSPLVFPTSVPATQPGGGWNTYTGPQEDGASAYANTGVIRYNGQNQPTKINQTWRP